MADNTPINLDNYQFVHLVLVLGVRQERGNRGASLAALLFHQNHGLRNRLSDSRPVLAHLSLNKAQIFFHRNLIQPSLLKAPSYHAINCVCIQITIIFPLELKRLRQRNKISFAPIFNDLKLWIKLCSQFYLCIIELAKYQGSFTFYPESSTEIQWCRMKMFFSDSVTGNLNHPIINVDPRNFATDRRYKISC